MNTNILARLDSATHFLRLVVIKVRLNLRSEASKTHLSYAWWVLEPILHMGVFYVVFKIFLRRGTDDFVAFLFCGLVPWLWFAKSISNSMLTIKGGKGLISQTYLPKAFFPMVSVSQDLFKQLWVILLLLAYLIVAGYEASFTWLWLIPIVLTQLAFIMAVAFCVAFCVPFALDLRYLVSTLLIFGMLGSGIFYDLEQVLIPEHHIYFHVNPMANLISQYRALLMDNQPPADQSLFWIFLGSMLFVWLMVTIMRRFDSTLTRLVID